jgi:hypothetical protein
VYKLDDNPDLKEIQLEKSVPIPDPQLFGLKERRPARGKGAGVPVKFRE